MKNPNTLPITPNKNIFLGFLLGVAVSATLGAALKPHQEWGRYQVAAGDGNTAYVIDTATGQIWSRIPSSAHYAKDFEQPKAESSKRP